MKKPCATRTGRSGVIRRRKWGDSARQIGGDSARRNGVIRRTPNFPGVIRRAESPLGNLARAESPHCAAPNHPWEIWRAPNHPIAARRITPGKFGARRITPLRRAESPHCAAPNHPRSAAPNHPQKNGNKFFEISIYISKTNRSIQKSFGGLRTNIIHYSSAKYEVCSLKIRVARPKWRGN